MSHKAADRAPQNLCLQPEPNTALCCHGLAQAGCLPVDSKLAFSGRKSWPPKILLGDGSSSSLHCRVPVRGDLWNLSSYVLVLNVL